MECNKYAAICQWPPGKGSWLMIDTYTPEYICSYTVYIYIIYIYINARVLYTYTVYTCIKRQGTTASCHTCNYTHLLGWTHAQRNMCIMWVNCWYKMQRLPIFHMSHRVCAKHPSPKISKTRPFAQALITSPNGKPDKLTPMRETFLGKSWEFSYIYLGRLILRLWSPPFKLQRMSKKFHFWTSQIKTAKISSKKNTLVKAEQLRPKGTDLKAKHQKQKKRIRCNSFKWPNYSCWCLV